MIATWKIIRKIPNLSEKMENKLRDIVQLTFTLWLLPWKIFFLVAVEKFFLQNIKEVGGHILTKMTMRWRAPHHIP